jgi:formylglycine-generating enzyme required for sulfatase activity
MSMRRARTLPIGAEAQRGTRPVGCYPPNDLQLYDMAGNVRGSTGIAPTPTARATATSAITRPRQRLRIVRGGSWVTHDVDQRAALIAKVPPDTYAYASASGLSYSDDGTEGERA